jgi:hypothetical protein
VRAESAGAGRGSAFTVRLPLAAAAVPAGRERDVKPPAGREVAVR